MAWRLSVIASGQTVGDIIHETDLFTTFARLAGTTEHIPELPGLSGAACFDLYTDPRETRGEMRPKFTVKGPFNIMKTPHQSWMEYQNTGEARAFPLTGSENARPETIAAGPPRIDVSKPPSDPFSSSKCCRSGAT
jgi:hypothetical protein